ncbi:MAG: lipopolysaccharide biosynthesis protein [Butyrivibrio sp.]|nr:lipopolysaccharide biosynthesis protein [Butyrivibrio sp.]
MTSHSLRAKAFINFFWRFAERIFAQLISFIVALILARILSPNDYGTVALIMIFTNIMQVLVDSGLANALVQKIDADDVDFSSVFFFNIVWGLILYFLLYTLAPFIAAFYVKPELVSLIRVLGLTVVVSGVKNVQQAYVSRTLQFKKFFSATLTGTLISAVVGIVLALKGFGAWAIVGQYLGNICIDTLTLWITVRWRPKKEFSFERLKTLLSYGWKLLASGLLDTFYQNTWQLVIGKVYSPLDLAYYNQGNKFPNIIVSNVNSSIDSVLLPVMSKEQNNIESVKLMTRRAIKTSVYIMSPLMFGLIATSEIVVRLILTEKWISCVPFLCVFCFANVFLPVHTANLNAIKAMGRSDLFLNLEIIKKLVGFLGLVISANIGVMAMAWMVVIISFLCQIINSWPNKYMLNYGYFAQLKDILPSIIISAGMGGVMYLIKYVPMNDYFILILQIIVGVAIYVFLSILFKVESFFYLLNLFKSFLGNIKRF